MPNKRNPITCEQICGLARIIRSNLLPAWENAIQWHERDLCNSSSERFIIPHSLILTDWILYKMNYVIKNLKVYPENMLKNIEITKGLIFAEAIMMKLVEKGMSRQEAHELVRKLSLKAKDENLHLKDLLIDFKDLFDEREIEEIFNAKNYIGKAVEIVEKSLNDVRKEIPQIDI